MKREYRKRKSEQLHQWVSRLADDVLWGRMEPDERREGCD